MLIIKAFKTIGGTFTRLYEVMLLSLRYRAVVAIGVQTRFGGENGRHVMFVSGTDRDGAETILKTALNKVTELGVIESFAKKDEKEWNKEAEDFLATIKKSMQDSRK